MQFNTIVKLLLVVLLLGLLLYTALVIIGVMNKPTMPWDQYMKKFVVVGYTDDKYITPDVAFNIKIKPNPTLEEYKNKNFHNLYVCVDGAYQYYKPLYVEKKADYAVMDIKENKPGGNSEERTRAAIKKYSTESCIYNDDNNDITTIKNYIKNFPKKYASKAECSAIYNAEIKNFYLPCNGKDGSITFNTIGSMGCLGGKYIGSNFNIKAKWLSVDFIRQETLVEYFDANSTKLPKPKNDINYKCWPGACDPGLLCLIDCCKGAYCDVTPGTLNTFDCETACKGNHICLELCNGTNKIPLKIRRETVPILTSLSYKVENDSENEEESKRWSNIQTDLVDDGRCVPYDPTKQLVFNMKLTTKNSTGQDIDFAEAYKPVYGPTYIYFRIYDESKEGERIQLWPTGESSAMLITHDLPFKVNLPAEGWIGTLSYIVQSTMENVAHATGNTEYDITKDYLTAKLPLIKKTTNLADFRYGSNKYTDRTYISPKCATGIGKFWYSSVMMRVPSAIMGQASNENFIKEQCDNNFDWGNFWTGNEGYPGDSDWYNSIW